MMSPVVRRYFQRSMATAEKPPAWVRTALSASYFFAVFAVISFFMAIKLSDTYGLWPPLFVGLILTIMTFGILVFVGIEAGTVAFTRRESRARRLIQFYYLCTPLFVLLDIGFSYSFRASFLSSEPSIRLVYYGLVFCLGVFLVWRPQFTEFVALTESSLTLILIIADLYLTITDLDSWLSPHASAADASALYRVKLVSFLVNGTVLTAAILKRRDAIDGTYKQPQQEMTT